MLNNFALIRLTLAAASLLGASSLALAGTATANLGISASVSTNCTISTTALAFGAYDPIGANATTPLNGSGAVSVACSKGSTGLTIGLNSGINASGTQRQLLAATSTDVLQYDLFQPASTTPGAACSFPASTAWDNTSTLTLTNAPSKAARTYNVCGTIPANQDVAADSYADTVIATINF